MHPAMVRSAAILGFLLLWTSGAWAQRIESVRGFDGGVAPTFNLTGPGTLYLDSQGTQGYLYNRGTFQTYTFRTPGGPAWNGALTTLGPNLTIGLIQGANQAGSGMVLPGPPRESLPVSPVRSRALLPPLPTILFPDPPSLIEEFP